MIQFTLPHPLTIDAAKQVFSSTAPKYQGIPGLVRKYYTLSADGSTAGGIYLWQSLDDAERFYTEEWRAFILEKYGARPVVTYFKTPVVVDNAMGEIVTES